MYLDLHKAYIKNLKTWLTLVQSKDTLLSHIHFYHLPSPETDQSSCQSFLVLTSSEVKTSCKLRCKGVLVTKTNLQHSHAQSLDVFRVNSSWGLSHWSKLLVNTEVMINKYWQCNHEMLKQRWLHVSLTLKSEIKLQLDKSYIFCVSE